MIAASAALSFVVAYAAVRLLLTHFSRFALDHPNERSLHERPVPRTGGIAILFGCAAGIALAPVQLWLAFGIAGALAVVSFLDDLYSMPSAGRLVAHLAASASFAWYVLSPMAPLELVLIVLAIAWLTNLYNFMDGSDGLAGGMSVIGFAGCAVGAHLAGHQGLTLLCSAVAAASVAFLIHNFHPARIFLGDVGSIPLGFLAGAVGILGWRDDAWPLWFPVVMFGPFIGDTTLTLLRRLVRGDRVWQAHREHYYQRMVRMGLGHRRTAFTVYAAMVVCAAAALLGRSASPQGQAVVFFGASTLLGAIAVWIDVSWSRFVRRTANPA